jgi:hypothetical protein
MYKWKIILFEGEMRKIKKYKLLVVIYITLQSIAATAGTWLEDNAQNLVSQYLDALTRGDTELVLNVIGGDLLKSRRSLLQNPDYPSYLIKAYTDTKVSVVDSRQLTADSVEVDVMIEKSLDEHYRLTFLVTTVKEKGVSDKSLSDKSSSDKRKALKIVSERNTEK